MITEECFFVAHLIPRRKWEEKEKNKKKTKTKMNGDG
jgi:hypothetical protein